MECYKTRLTCLTLYLALYSTLRKKKDFEKNFLRVLPGLHDFLGCDLMSAFHRIGKEKGLNIVKGNKEYCKTLGLLGESVQIEDHLFDLIANMVRQVYGFWKKPNEVRYEKGCGVKFPETSKIRTNKGELHQHVKCVHYQAFAWKNALEAKQETPNSDQYGCGVIGNI